MKTLAVAALAAMFALGAVASAGACPFSQKKEEVKTEQQTS